MQRDSKSLIDGGFLLNKWLWLSIRRYLVEAEKSRAISGGLVRT